jgi:hypothetical protein
LSRRYPRKEQGLLEIWINTGTTTPAAARATAPKTTRPGSAPATPAVPVAAGLATATTDAKIRAFLDDYCRIYETRDPDRLAALFDAAATENGRPFKDLLPRYRTNMARLEHLSYRIDMARWEERADAATLAVEGRFTARGLMANRKQFQSQGTIVLDIVPNGDSFKVARLQYQIEP